MSLGLDCALAVFLLLLLLLPLPTASCSKEADHMHDDPGFGNLPNQSVDIRTALTNTNA